MDPVSVIAVANTFLEFANEEGRLLTHMELQKHSFFAHAWHLANMDEPLFDDAVQAWKFGPVVPRLYHAFKGFKNNPVNIPGVEFDPIECEVIVPTINSPKIRAFLKTVWNAYKEFSAGRLSAMSHEPGGPWDQTYEESENVVVKNLVIPNRLIADFYRQKITPNHG